MTTREHIGFLGLEGRVVWQFFCFTPKGSPLADPLHSMKVIFKSNPTILLKPECSGQRHFRLGSKTIKRGR